KSMREDGFTQPVVCQRATREIVDGEHRWRAAQVLNLPQIPVVFVDMTAEQMRIATLRHNRARGSEDIGLSAQVLRDLRDLGALAWAQDSLELDDTEVNRLLEDIAPADALAGDEFKPAWVPGGEQSRDDGQSVGGEAQGRDVSISADASTRLRAAETVAAKAKTGEERASAIRDAGVYRLMLIFSAEEAEEVKAALEPTPAANLLALVRAARAS
ncbi:MAG: ParB/RepB/Spo0J family partition protein, partial [Terriglobales bacterium]